jgi:2-iminobutanoate/2-iminopropanoate deaminase
MTIKRIGAGPGLPTGFPFSLAGEAGGVCFISGMPALDPDGKFKAGTFEEEAELAWQNVVGIAAASGYAKNEIVYVQCVVADIGDYANMNAWWRKQFPTSPLPQPGSPSRQVHCLSARRSRSRRWLVVGAESSVPAVSRLTRDLLSHHPRPLRYA